jgi:hypothetical protein
MSNVRIISDTLTHNDTMKQYHDKSTFRTQIICGTDPYLDKFGNTKFGTELFRTENMTLIAGSIFSLEKLANLRLNSDLKVSLLSDYFNDNNLGAPVDGEGNPVWTELETDILSQDNALYLFGVGIGGAGESIADVSDVKYVQRNISEMIPFTIVGDDSELQASDHDKYFCRINPINSNEGIKYYLKKFDSAEIKCKWRDSDEEASGSDVGSDYYTSESTTPIETFLELKLTISKQDVRDYFTGDIEKTRINTIGLYTATPKKLYRPINVQYDASNGGTIQRTIEYDQVRCFSAFNFDNEMLSLPKDITFLYRIFSK